MNKGIVAIAGIILITAAGVVYACGSGSNEGKMDMKGMKHHGMMEKQVVATSDGGVVIVTGNKIVKYDRNLKFVNEAELSGCSMMMKKDGCSKCAMKGMDHKMMNNDGDEDKSEVENSGNKGVVTTNEEK